MEEQVDALLVQMVQAESSVPETRRPQIRSRASRGARPAPDCAVIEPSGDDLILGYLTGYTSELLDLLENAEHWALRAAHRSLTSAEPPTKWPELASRVGQTEQWIRELAKREFGEQIGAR